MWRCTIRYVINISKNTPYSPYPCSEYLLLTVTVAYTLVIQHTFPESLNRQIFNSSDILKCNSNDDYSFCYYLSSHITSCMVCSGSFVATSETQEVISAGLRMIQNLVGPSAFGGREDSRAWIRHKPTQKTQGCSTQPQLCCGTKHFSWHQALNRVTFFRLFSFCSPSLQRNMSHALLICSLRY